MSSHLMVFQILDEDVIASASLTIHLDGDAVFVQTRYKALTGELT
jgi:hypothetical protein